MPTLSAVASDCDDSLLHDECDGDSSLLDAETGMVKSVEDDGISVVEELDGDVVKMLMDDPTAQSVVTMRKNSSKLLRLSGLVVNKQAEKQKNLWERKPDEYDENTYFGDPTNGHKIGEKWDSKRKRMVTQRKKPRREELTDMYVYLVNKCREKYKIQLQDVKSSKLFEGSENFKPKYNPEKANKMRPASLNNLKQIIDMIEGGEKRLHNMQGTVPESDFILMMNNMTVVKKMFSDAMSLLELSRDTCGSLYNVLNGLQRNGQLSDEERNNCEGFYDTYAEKTFINIPGQPILLESNDEEMETSVKKPSKTEGPAKSVLNWSIKSEKVSPCESGTFSPSVGVAMPTGHFTASSIEPLGMGSHTQVVSLKDEQKEQADQLQNLPVTVLMLNEDRDATKSDRLVIPASLPESRTNIELKTDKFTPPRVKISSPRSPRYNILSVTEKELSDSLSRTSLTGVGLPHGRFSEPDKGVPKYQNGIKVNTTENNNIVTEAMSSPTHEQVLPSIGNFLSSSPNNQIGRSYENRNSDQYPAEVQWETFLENESDNLRIELSPDELMRMLSVDPASMFEESETFDLGEVGDIQKTNDVAMKRHSTDTRSDLSLKRMRLG